MGAEITTALIPEKNQVLIDWLSWTLKTKDPREAIELSGLSCMDFSESSGGGMGYKSSLRSGNIVVFYDGNENMGCHISMSGKGCRAYEAMKDTAHCWYQLLVRLQNENANFTRLDLAIDNVDGGLCLDKLETAIREKHTRTKCRKSRKIEELALTGEEQNLGKTIYLGSPQSRLKIRFYDKAAEQQLNGHWVRCELQCMSERAQEAVKHLLNRVEVGTLAASALNNYFAVINLDDSNKTRCSLQDWWAAWILSTEKLKLSTMKAIKYVPEVMEHIKRQYSASLALCKRYLGVVRFHEYIHDLINTGLEKQTKKHEMILQCSKLELTTDLPF